MNTPIIVKYPLDLTGVSANNLVLAEPHEIGTKSVRAVVTNHGPFYTQGILVRDARDGRPLRAGEQYMAMHLYEEVVERTGLEVCAVIVITDPTVSSKVTIDYQVVGGEYSSSVYAIRALIDTLSIDEREVVWGKNIIGLPTEFPPTHHLHDAGDLYGFEYVVEALEKIHRAILIGDQASHDEIYAYIDVVEQRIKDNAGRVELKLDNHIADKANPHKVTKAQVGLGSVPNYGPANSTTAKAGTANNQIMTPLLVKTAIDYFAGNKLDSHIANTSNPHKVTKAQVGLGNVPNYGVATTASAEAGTANNQLMTPLLVKTAINKFAVTPLNAHIADRANPHKVTKAQVGLGSVPNYGPASTASAEAGTANNQIMTPLLVKAAINKFAIAPLNAHIANTSNPHKVTKAQVGLGSVPNYGPASTASAEAGTANNQLMTPLLVKTAINKFAIAPLNAHIADKANPHKVTKAQVGLGSVSNYATASVKDVKSASTTFSDVFSSWRRYSHRGGVVNANPDEKNAWVYDAATESIRCTINSVTTIGFVTPDLYTDYSFAAQLSSTSSDDDRIGLCLAFVDSGGSEHTITAFRVFEGSGAENTTLRIWYNYGLTGAKELFTDKGILVPDTSNWDNGKGGGGWSGSKVRLRAVRVGNKITVSSTGVNQTGYKTAANYVIDLDSDPVLHKFRNGARLGFMCQSQPQSTWAFLESPWSRDDRFMTPYKTRLMFDQFIDLFDARYTRNNATSNSSLRVVNGQLQGYVDGAWRVIWPAQWS